MKQQPLQQQERHQQQEEPRQTTPSNRCNMTISSR
jgi:hypothetical protein